MIKKKDLYLFKIQKLKTHEHVNMKIVISISLVKFDENYTTIPSLLRFIGLIGWLSLEWVKADNRRQDQ